MNLIRLLMLNLEDESEVDLSDYSEEQIGYHNYLLVDSGLALEPIRKLLNRTRYAHKRTAQRPTNSRFFCTIECEYYAFWPANQASFPRPNAVLDASALQELVLAMVRRVAVCEQCVSDNWLWIRNYGHHRNHTLCPNRDVVLSSGERPQ